MKFIVGFMLFICAALPLAFYNGVVVADCWNWFIKVSLGLPALSSLQGWGIMLFIGSTQVFSTTQKIVKQKIDNPDRDSDDDNTVLGNSILLYTSFFLGLLFVHGYMWLIHNLFW